MKGAPDIREVARVCAALDRRAFLRGLGLAAGAGLLPTGCDGAPRHFAPAPGQELRHLTPRTYAVLTAAAERIVGGRGADWIRSRQVDPGAHADAFLATAPEFAPALGQALLALEFGVFPLIGKLRPFTSLGEAGRDAVLSELAGSRLLLKRMLFGGVRTLSLLGFYSARETHALIGYPDPDRAGDATIQDAMTYPLDW
jgi:hypothetical protein